MHANILPDSTLTKAFLCISATGSLTVYLENDSFPRLVKALKMREVTSCAVLPSGSFLLGMEKGVDIVGEK